MTPYYQDELVTLYHGDCLEVLPQLTERVGLMLTDPPYGIKYKPLRGSNGSKMWGDETVRGDDVEFDPTHLLGYKNLILWGANNYSHRLPKSAGWFVWDKTPRGIREGFIYSHCELAWTNIINRVQKFSLEWQGADRSGESFLHPTQKPVGLMRWCTEQWHGEGVIVDPYVGSGSTLVAAKQLYRKAVGIEIEERYCEISARRLTQEMSFAANAMTSTHGV